MAGPYTEAIKQLIELDALDQELLALRAERAETPNKLVAQEAEIGIAAEARDLIAARLATAQSGQRSHEADLEDVERRRTRASKRLEALYVAEQISATEREITQLGEQADELEMSILEFMEQVDVASAELERANGAIAHADKGLASDKVAWEARVPVVDARITELDAAVAALIPQISGEAHKAYRIGYENRSNRRRQGCTRTDGVMCILCRTEIPARWVNEARNGDGIQRCLGCKRVLVGAAPDTEGSEEGAYADL